MKFIESILGRSNNLVVVARHTGEVTYVSPASKSILGYEPSELIGYEWWNKTLTDPAERERLKRYARDVALRNVDQDQRQYERCFVTPQGMRKWILWEAVPGPGKSVISIGHDITRRKLAELDLDRRNEQLRETNAALIDSLNYAQKIQDVLLPDPSQMNSHLTDSFVFYRPRDIVSGDFYFFRNKEDVLYVAGADCTGHGVPGAMMSVLGTSLLRDAIREFPTAEPDEILRLLDTELITAMTRESGEGLKDGMDIALVKYDPQSRSVSFSGAYRSLLLVRDGNLREIAGSRYPIGHFEGEKFFSNVRIDVQSGDRLYMFSDGVTDQFGGEHDKKFNRKRLKELILGVQEMPMREQGDFVEYAMNNWMQTNEQTDDMLLIGMEI